MQSIRLSGQPIVRSHVGATGDLGTPKCSAGRTLMGEDARA
jgi:hypothetical protein